MLDEFLDRASERRTGGGQCATCRHPQADGINRDLLAYVKRAAIPEGEPGYTDRTWLDVYDYLAATYHNLPADHRSVRRHALRCLGVEVRRG